MWRYKINFANPYRVQVEPAPNRGANVEIAAIIHRVEDVTEIVRRHSEGEASVQVLGDQRMCREDCGKAKRGLARELAGGGRSGQS